MNFAGRLREILLQRGKNLSDLARHMGVTSQAVGQWGNSTHPTIDKLPDIAKYLGVTIPELMSPVGAPFAGSGLTGGPPEVTRLVYKRDEIALLDFWDDLTPDERDRAFRILRASTDRLDSAA